MKLDYRIGTFLDAPIYFNLSILLCLPYFWAEEGAYAGTVVAAGFIVLMLAHEMGHAWFVRKYGHELLSIKIYPVHGVCNYRYDSNFAVETMVHAGGLLVQAIILVPFVVIFRLLDYMKLHEVLDFIAPLGTVFIGINLFLLVFNALPVPGLDGFTLWSRFGDFISERYLQPLAARSRSAARKNNKTPEKIVDIALKRAQKKK